MIDSNEVEEFQQAVKETIAILRVNADRIEASEFNNAYDAANSWRNQADKLEEAYNRYFGLESIPTLIN